MSENRFTSIMDIMNSFVANAPKSDIDQEYFEMEARYFELFGHGIPREMFPDSITTAQIKEAMKSCIENKSDELYCLLGVTVNDEYMY